MARAEQGGRTAVEVVLLGAVVAAVLAPLSARVAWARDASEARRRHAAAIAREVLAHAAARPLELLAQEFRPRDADGEGRMPQHRALGPRGQRRNPLALPEELVREIDAQALQVRVYYQPERDERAGRAWVDVLDGRELDATGDAFRALLAHRSRALAARRRV